MGSSLVLSRHHRSEIRLAGLAEASRRCGAARSQAQFTNTFSAADGNSRPPPALIRVAHAPFASTAYVGNATNQKYMTFIFITAMNGIDFLRRFGECCCCWVVDDIGAMLGLTTI
jgi:hypothetical protein